MKRVIHLLLATALFVSSTTVTAIADEASTGQQILYFLQHDASSTGTVGNEYTVTRTQPIITDTYTYQEARFSMEVPKGWEVLATGNFADTLCVRAWDPDCPARCFFQCTKVEPFLRDERARSWYQDRASDILPAYQLLSGAPVLEELSLPCFLQHASEVREFAKAYSNLSGVLDWRVFPQIDNLRIFETAPNPMPCLSVCEDNSMARITFFDENGAGCEGVITAQPCRNDSIVVSDVDLGSDTVLYYMGFYAPVGELRELEPVLSKCLISLTLTDHFIEDTIRLRGEVDEVMRQLNQITINARSGYDSTWESRTDEYDILSQEWSDAMLGYDRLFDSETGEVYC